jgi:hypothetical protein
MNNVAAGPGVSFVNEDGTRLRPGQFHELVWGAQRRAGLRRIPRHGCGIRSRASSSRAALPCASCSGGSGTPRSRPASGTVTSRPERVNSVQMGPRWARDRKRVAS